MFQLFLIFNNYSDLLPLLFSAIFVYSSNLCLFVVSVNLKYLRSLFASLYKLIIIQSTMIENGKAVMIAIFCRAFNPLSPPENNKINAINACAIPQTTLIIADGFNEPNVVCIPNTKVAESADVIKNVAINSNVTMDSTKPNGTSLNTPNNAVSGGISNIFGLSFAVSIPRTP